MVRLVFALAGIVYLGFLAVVWSVLRVAGLADATDADVERMATRPCPVCDSMDVYVDTDDICLCTTCRASYPLSNAQGTP